MAPYYCYIHNGIYSVGANDDGCQDVYCIKFRELDVPPVGVHFAPMPGGTTIMAQKADHERKFNHDMHTYREARRQGLEPDTISSEAVIDADKIAQGDKDESDRYTGAL